MKVRHVIIIFAMLLAQFVVQAQDRFDTLRSKLVELSATSPGLNQPVDFSVRQMSIQEFLRGLAETNSLNISIDPALNVKVYHNFTDSKVIDVLIFLCKEHQLDIGFVGSIMRVRPYATPVVIKKVEPHVLKVTYVAGQDWLSFDLNQDTIEQVAKKITQVSGKNVVLSPDVKRDIRVNGFIQNKPFQAALDKLAFANGLELEKTDDDFYVLKPRTVEEVVENNTNGRNSTRNQRNNGRQNNRNANANSQSGEFFLEVKDSIGYKWVTFEASDMPIADAINEVSNEMKENYFLFSEPQGNTTSAIQNMRYVDFLRYILQGTDHTFKTDEGIYLIGERKLEGLRATKVVQLQYRSFEDVMNAIPAEIREGVTISEFQELNSFILSGSSLQIAEIESFIHEIDKSVPMIMIEVILVDIKKGRSLKTGISAGISDTVTPGGTLLPGIDFVLGSKSVNDAVSRLGLAGGPLNLGRVTPNFYLSLSALDQQQNVNVRSMPKLSTLNGHEATMRIGQTRYYRLQTQNVVGSVTTSTLVTEQFNSVQADLAITIRPVVSGDDQVTLDIDVEISDFIGEPEANAPPPSTTSQFTSMVRVGDEEMVLLGGLERIERSESGEGTPILSRIPIIKWFFSKRSKSKSKSISVVFIKPTIIH